MQRSDDFLRAVEARLRCTVDRRRAVVEELRGHLADRVAALVEQGGNAEVAEGQAVREMGPAWLLALRLSTANGWNVLAHLLRELWAACLAFLLVTLAPQVIIVRNPDVHLSSGAFVTRGLEYLAVLAGLAAFGFAMGRTVRGWGWSLIAILAAAANAPHLLRDLLAAGAVVLVSASLGQRRESPKLQAVP